MTTIKSILTKAYPISYSQSLDVASAISQLYLFSKLGKEQLDAAELIERISIFLLAPIDTISTQSTVFLAVKHGQMQGLQGQTRTRQIHREMGNIILQGWGLGILAYIVPALISIGIKPMLTSSGQNEEVSSIVSAYFVPYIIGFPITLLVRQNYHHLPGIDKEKWLLLLKTISTGAKIIFNFIFILKYETAGAGYAFLAEAILDAIVCAIYFRYDNLIRSFDIINSINIRRMLNLCSAAKYLKKMFLQSLPLVFLLYITTGMNLLTSLWIGKVANGHYLGLIGAITAWAKIAHVFVYGPIIAAKRIISQKLGAEQFQEIVSTGYKNIFLAILTYAAISVLFCSISIPLVSVFFKNSDKSGVEIFSESTIQKVFIMFFVLENLRVFKESLVNSLVAIEDTLFPAMANVLSVLAISLPSVAIAANVSDANIDGILVGLIISETICSIALFRYWYTQSRQIQSTQQYSIDNDTSNAKFKRYIGRCSCNFFRGSTYRSIGEESLSTALLIN